MVCRKRKHLSLRFQVCLLRRMPLTAKYLVVMTTACCCEPLPLVMMSPESV